MPHFFRSARHLPICLYAAGVYCWVMLRKDCGHRLRFPLATTMRDRALSATAVWLSMREEDSAELRLRRLVELGADPGTQNWLALRMAACAGREDTVRWLAARSRPSEYALGDAINWARQNGRVGTIAALEEMRAVVFNADDSNRNPTAR